MVFENIIVKASIMATSDKTYKGRKADDTSRKSLYIIPTTEDDVKKLIDFGLTKYTSKQDKQDFFIIKASKEVKLYERNIPESFTTLPLALGDNNITTGEIDIAITKGQVDDNTFYRAFAFLVKSMDDIKDVVASNPFS